VLLGARYFVFASSAARKVPYEQVPCSEVLIEHLIANKLELTQCLLMAGGARVPHHREVALSCVSSLHPIKPN
jgi:hypothetical protein